MIGPIAPEPVYGMGYDADFGILYALPGNSNNMLYTIDPMTGTLTELVTLSRTEYFASMAVVFEPPTAVPSMSFGGLALLAGLLIGTTGRRRLR
jgi:hypothetical protein